MYLDYYLNKLGYYNIDSTIKKYLEAPSLTRLKKVGYFCGMDYASKDIYDFTEYISRYDHSLTVSLLSYKLTGDINTSLAGLFHDIATPCFSHVIDYMNKDYLNQESTEEYTEHIIKSDKYLCSLLDKDGINVEDIINYKKYSIVDNDRPKLCADRLDGVILTGIGWTKNIDYKDIDDITSNIKVFTNEFGEKEIGFTSPLVAKKVIEVSKSIDLYCHSKEDNYMMELLASIAKYMIDKKYISYDDLYYYDEEELFNLFSIIDDEKLRRLLYEFKNIKRCDIPVIEMPEVKVRKLFPLYNNKRIIS